MGEFDHRTAFAAHHLQSARRTRLMHLLQESALSVVAVSFVVLTGELSSCPRHQNEQSYWKRDNAWHDPRPGATTQHENEQPRKQQRSNDDSKHLIVPPRG